MAAESGSQKKDISIAFVDFLLGWWWDGNTAHFRMRREFSLSVGSPKTTKTLLLHLKAQRILFVYRAVSFHSYVQNYWHLDGLDGMPMFNRRPFFNFGRILRIHIMATDKKSIIDFRLELTTWERITPRWWQRDRLHFRTETGKALMSFCHLFRIRHAFSLNRLLLPFYPF